MSSAFYDTASLYKSGYQLSDNNFLCGTVAVADDIYAGCGGIGNLNALQIIDCDNFAFTILNWDILYTRFTSCAAYGKHCGIAAAFCRSKCERFHILAAVSGDCMFEAAELRTIINLVSLIAVAFICDNALQTVNCRAVASAEPVFGSESYGIACCTVFIVDNYFEIRLSVGRNSEKLNYIAKCRSGECKCLFAVWLI